MALTSWFWFSCFASTLATLATFAALTTFVHAFATLAPFAALTATTSIVPEKVVFITGELGMINILSHSHVHMLVHHFPHVIVHGESTIAGVAHRTGKTRGVYRNTISDPTITAVSASPGTKKELPVSSNGVGL